MLKDQTKIGICQWSVPMNGPYSCKLVSELGIEGIQLEMGDPHRGYPLSKEVVYQAYMELGEQYGVAFTSIVNVATTEFSITRPQSPEKYEVVMTSIRKSIETAAAMNIPLIMIPSFGKSEIRNEDDLIQTVEVLTSACDYAQEKNIYVATENLLPVEGIFHLFEQVNRSNLKLYFDTQNHFLRKGYDIPEMIRKLASLFCNEVHIKDGKDGHLSGSLLGEGESGFYRSLAALEEVNYTGWLVLENYYDREPLSFRHDQPVQLIKKDLKILNDALKKF
ncbi:hypothetical protein Elgi_74550 [Paenibacillus elgii]|uniref:sugar phosphate isomerase/epimerase family protein n=1 Tax=Paenibacillus elgii TaxID=189691 RepID=UPI002D7B0409|nr:hypothetical protein Elgi_74550 [Paenibacillus elgii]